MLSKAVSFSWLLIILIGSLSNRHVSQAGDKYSSSRYESSGSDWEASYYSDEIPALNKEIKKFNSQLKLALSTSKITLAPEVRELMRIKDAFDIISAHGSEAKELKERASAQMGEKIEAIISLMSGTKGTGR